MRVVLGIGNPGSRYYYNRHNAGFLFLDFFAQLNSLIFIASSGDYYEAIGEIDSHRFSLIKPTTYVNNSGMAASQIVEKYNLSVTDLIIVCDDVNLKTGTFRLRLSGGDGGHNGLSSIIYHLSSDQFSRLRMGVGKDQINYELSDYVLSNFEKSELKLLEGTYKDSAYLVKEFILGGTKRMLEANSKLIKPDNN